MTCKENGCARKERQRGYCSDHYYRARRCGILDTLKPRPLDKLPAELFKTKYRINEYGCWMWTGAKAARGYGLILDLQSRKVRAHRFSFELHRGPIPKGMDVLHECDTPGCVNPSHLFLGSQAENMADKVRKGRQARGESSGHAKLTEEDVRRIRLLHANGGISIGQLAREHGINRAGVSRIVHRHTWRSVE